MDTTEARELLEAERERLVGLREAQEGEERTWQDGVDGGDQPADAAANLHEREIEEGVHEFVEERLAAVDQAMARLEQGTYGKCDSCGGEIPDERLRELPATERCVEHA